MIQYSQTQIAHIHELGAIRRMSGLPKIDQPAPTDDEVTAILDERRVEKYL